ncbi:uncharacterized protein SPSK_05707 [Sporothrix schenckii 1099-18]|uniref:Uncharacterized protein n=1 Tax=Sporothrix schenckii 1099-18 TaxID=1397361 RepID=A0A0F2LUR2_SPOSC|nr:uncharacterized protein SPSK_05707 [Sporothrix schenckii 1099-18]KJR80579.1 hypothetical protein SPSK_05707 [Sporothrix schenckii 1099-18]
MQPDLSKNEGETNARQQLTKSDKHVLRTTEYLGKVSERPLVSALPDVSVRVALARNFSYFASPVACRPTGLSLYLQRMLARGMGHNVRLAPAWKTFQLQRANARNKGKND